MSKDRSPNLESLKAIESKSFDQETEKENVISFLYYLLTQVNPNNKAYSLICGIKEDLEDNKHRKEAYQR